MSDIIVLGASGSVGTQCLKVIKDNPNTLNLLGVSVYSDDAKLAEILSNFASIQHVCIGPKMNLSHYQKTYPHINFYQGNSGLVLLASQKVDLVVNAIVGFAGLEPTLAAIDAHNDIALANKECLVAAGDLICKMVALNDVDLYPIDSEHSAIFQCLQGEPIGGVRRLIITASGGPFRDRPTSELANVTVAEAIHHPTWVMGPKISVDSATLVNKGLEVIEAHHLFGLDYNRIDVVLQPESIVHSMVEFKDGSVKAQLGAPNMEVPIQYALFKGQHRDKFDANLNFGQPLTINFKPLDPFRFEAVMLAYEVGRKGGSYPIVYNAANEVAVAAFLAGKLPFNQIVPLIKLCLKEHVGSHPHTLQEICNVDAEARASATALLTALKEAQS